MFGTDYPTPDGTCIRDYVHVCDMADARLLAFEWLEGGGQGGAFNLGYGAGFSVQQVVEAVRAVTGHPVPVLSGPRRAGDPAVLVASSEKARQVLGWRPRYPELAEIVESAWRWHKRQG